jgi:hypothetical protein
MLTCYTYFVADPYLRIPLEETYGNAFRALAGRFRRELES